MRLSQLVCEALNWRRPDGRLKDMSCRVAMLRMQDDGLIQLPPPLTSLDFSQEMPRLSEIGSRGTLLSGFSPQIGMNRTAVAGKRN
jgi:hypothetical protein